MNYDDHVLLFATTIILVSGDLSWSCQKEKVVPKKKSRAKKKRSCRKKKSRAEKKESCQKEKVVPKKRNRAEKKSGTRENWRREKETWWEKLGGTNWAP